MRKLLANLVNYIENIKIFVCIRRGLVMTIPILLIGSMAFVIKTMPIDIYQNFINVFANGLILKIATFIYDATFGILSIFITFSISVCYAQSSKIKSKYIYGAPIISLATFFILIGASTKSMCFTQYLGVNGMFIAIVSSLISSYIYEVIFSKGIRILNVYADGIDSDYNNSCSVILPAIIVLLFASLINYLIQLIFNASSFQDLFVILSNKIFDGMGRTLFSGILFTAISSILWFFGIRGSNFFVPVAQENSILEVESNIACLANALESTEIINETFFNIFVVMGGCGATLCLFLAIMLFSKRKSSRGLAKFSIFPMLFNINEPMVFGLPIIFNPILFIPFIITPIVFVITTYFAMANGFVPFCTSTVEWTTPVLMSGYIATGSINGSILQIINLIIGIFIYKPFVKVLDVEKINSMKRNVEILKNEFINYENEGKEMFFLMDVGFIGDTAKMLVEDLKYAISHDEFEIYYQLQYNNNGIFIGAEALLRWNHSVCGMIYPPLVIKLADEANILTELEQKVFKIVADDLKNKFHIVDNQFKVCINITIKSLQKGNFEAFLKDLSEKEKLNPNNICIEITEHDSYIKDALLEEKLNNIKQIGYSIAIDDFSMGRTSIYYLKSSLFDMVKLDGSLVKSINENQRCVDIIESIVKLGHSLGFDVLAEYVETKEQLKILEEIGCTKYQGYLFSKAVTAEELVKMIDANKVVVNKKL